LERGLNAKNALREAIKIDGSPELRQVGVITVNGEKAVHCGNSIPKPYGFREVKDCTCTGNLLSSTMVLDHMVEAYVKTKGNLLDKIISALKAGHNAGGDARGDKSATVIIVGEISAYGKWYDRIVDVRVDLSRKPLDDLENIVKELRINL